MEDLSERIRTELLPRVRQPAQYVGLEVNARCADVDAAEVSVALCFPDTYGIGISHLGTQLLYAALNDLPYVAADRAYCPAPDAEAVMRETQLPLWGWESRRALGDFDVLGFSLAYELCVTNVLTMLDLSGVPLRAEARDERHPLVVGGNAMADAPEPVAPFFDVLCVGDGEASLRAIGALLRDARPAGLSREQLLLRIAAEAPGAYVPRFYAPRSDEPMSPIRPLRDDVPAVIHRARIGGLGDSPALRRPLVPLSEAVHERVMIEVMRGCPNACRFCQAGTTGKPVRLRSVEEIVSIAREAIDATGYRELSLLSLSTSDYPHLDELIERLHETFADEHVSVSLPSLRVDAQLRYLPKLASKVRKPGLTIAAEAGSDRLRDAIRKDITEADMVAGVRAAFEAGFRSVKVYFICGLPGETEEDLDAIVRLCRCLSDTRREVDGHKGSITGSVSWFVPKPHTPMQYAAMPSMDYCFAVRRRLREGARRSPVTFRFHWIERSFLEGVLARGSRRLAAAIERVWREGARMDSWDEHFDFARWEQAFEAEGITPEELALAELDPDGPTPWSHIHGCRAGEDFLRREYTEMRRMLNP